MNKLSQINLGPSGGFKGPGTGLFANPSSSPQTTLERVISTTIGVITIVGFIYFVIQIISAAISWIGAGGDSKKVSDAQKKIQNSVVGLVVLISATFLISLVGNMLGIDILNISAAIIRLGGG